MSFDEFKATVLQECPDVPVDRFQFIDWGEGCPYPFRGDVYVETGMSRFKVDISFGSRWVVSVSNYSGITVQGFSDKLPAALAEAFDKLEARMAVLIQDVRWMEKHFNRSILPKEPTT